MGEGSGQAVGEGGASSWAEREGGTCHDRLLTVLLQAAGVGEAE